MDEIEELFERKVSCIPGAEGAPLEKFDAGMIVVRLVVEVR